MSASTASEKTAAKKRTKTSDASSAKTTDTGVDAPVVKKSAKAAVKAASGATKTAATAKKTKAKTEAPAAVVPEERRRYYIEVAAYYIAERRGFNGGSEVEDWVQAEKEIDHLLRTRVIGSEA